MTQGLQIKQCEGEFVFVLKYKNETKLSKRVKNIVNLVSKATKKFRLFFMFLVVLKT